MTAGRELKSARDRAGLSAAQISERTKIQLYKIAALEHDDYGQLPQGIYLDGIVRAYAHEVGIAADPMVDRVRLERGKLPGDWEVPFAAPIELHPASSFREDVPSLEDIQVLSEPHGVDGLDAFSAERDLAAAPIEPDEYRAVQRDEYRADDRPLSVSVPVPVSARQRTGLALPLLVLLAAVGLGMFFYQSARSLDRDAAPPTAATESRPDSSNDMARVETADAAQRKSRPAEVPTAFSENVITPDVDQRAPAAPTAGAVTRDIAGKSSSAVAAPSAAIPTRRVESATVAPPARPERPVRMETEIAAPSSAPDVTGSWKLATQIESSSLSRFQGLKLGYEMQLEQDGDRVTGTGRKITENGNGIGLRSQTPVTVSGTIDGDRLTLNFVERGVRRPTQGKFVLLVDDAGTLRGRFSSDAARSSGRVEAHRVSTQ